MIDVEKELSSLNHTMNKYIPDESKILKSKNNLNIINAKLWDLEDGKRAAERENHIW